MNRRRPHSIMAILVGMALSACNSSAGDVAHSFVVATLDSSVITMTAIPKSNRAADAGDMKRSIDALIDEELLYRKALALGLDRDPDISEAMARARRQVLARAYAARVVHRREPISDSEKIAYYDSHPALFSRRCIYRFSIYTARRSKLDDRVLDQLQQLHTASEVQAILRANNVDYELHALTRAAEQLPPLQLRRFAAAKSGDLLTFALNNDRANLVLLTAIEEKPLDVKAAQPIIEQYLRSAHDSAALSDELERARAEAKISYARDWQKQLQMPTRPNEDFSQLTHRLAGADVDAPMRLSAP